jgi:hypothetical protein
LRCLAAVLFVSFGAVVSAQITEPPPGPLLEAGHCLAAADRDWLDVGPEKPYRLELGYVAANATDTAKNPLYLVEYTTPTHTEGFAFAFLTHGKETHRELLLQYRARFRQSDDGSQQLSLVDPPLGGVGTQDEILAAIKQVGFHTWKVAVADLKSHAGSTRCETAEGIM